MVYNDLGKKLVSRFMVDFSRLTEYEFMLLSSVNPQKPKVVDVVATQKVVNKIPDTGSFYFFY